MEYHPTQKKNRQYYLPTETYHKTKWLIREYPAKKAKYASTGTASGMVIDGLPKGSGTSDPTLRAVDKRLRLREDIDAVESALRGIPEEYRSGVMAAIIERKRFPDDAATSTYRRWLQRFIFLVAYEKGWID